MTIRKNVTENITEVVEGRSTARTLRASLLMVSYLYRAGLILRHLAYKMRFFKAKQVPAYVVSVGNIAVGGTGKTPFVRLLAEECRQFAKTAILSRGYLSQVECSRKSVRAAITSDASEIGDEPLWLARVLPDVSVFVGKNRALSAAQAFSEGCNLLLLDDGLQHRQLHRNKEIVILDGDNPWGGNQFLPRGPLRDFPSRIKDADLIVLNPYREELVAQVRQRIKKPLVGVEWKFTTKIPACVGLFCAIGKPDRFIHMVGKEADIVSLLRLPDHMAPDPEELRHLASSAKERGAEALVCTEKDAVKLPQDLALALPIIPIAAELCIVHGKKEWEKFLNHIREDV